MLKHVSKKSHQQLTMLITFPIIGNLFLIPSRYGSDPLAVFRISFYKKIANRNMMSYYLLPTGLDITRGSSRKCPVEERKHGRFFLSICLNTSQPTIATVLFHPQKKVVFFSPVGLQPCMFQGQENISNKL